MSQAITLAAQTRTDLGKGASRRLRHQALVPAIIYGTEKEPLPITLKQTDLTQVVDKEAFFSIITLEVDGKPQKVLVKDIQRHHYKPLVNHLDFLYVDDHHVIKAHVPLHFLNEAKCLGVKAGGLISHDSIELEVACLPKDLPDFIEVDVSELNIGDSIHLSQLNLPEGVVSTELQKGEDHDHAVVTVVKTRGPSEDETAEGETPAEGAE